MRFACDEDEYIVWAVCHYGSDLEIAHDLGRTRASINQRIKELRKHYDLPDRRGFRKENLWKKPRSAGTLTGAEE